VVAEALGRVPGGEEGAGLQWSPDSARIAVLADGTLYVMNADGSKRQSLAKNVLIEHILGSPNIAWSPDGTKIAYASASDDRDQFRIWSVAHDGSAQMLIFEGSGRSDGLTGGPVWSPDGTRIAFRYDTTMDDKTWLIANADGSGDVHEIGDLQPLSWRGGWFFCECYG
jgi:Tol biopolymer transport system component